MAQKPRYRLVGGMRMPLGFPPGGLESGLAYQPAATDIFVASYPKCGTTWLQYIVWLLVRGTPLGPGDALTALFPHLEEVGAPAVSSLPPPRLIKTHLAYGIAPFSSAATYIVIARNPFDCVVSFYHHTRGFPRHYDFAHGSFADFFDCFIEGEVDWGDYFEHLLSWRAEAARANVLWLTYESLRADPAAGIRLIAEFPGVARTIAGADRDIEAIVRETSLGSMQREQQRWSSRRPDWAPGFVREGAVGGWQSLFTPRMAARLLAKCERCLGPDGIDRIWPDVAAAARAFTESRS